MLDSLPQPTEEQKLPWLATAIRELNSTGWAAEIYDADWKLIWISEEMKQFIGSERNYGNKKAILEVYSLPIWREIIDDASHQAMIDSIWPYLPDNPDRQDQPPLWSVKLNLAKSSGPGMIECLSFPIRIENKIQATIRVYGPGLRASVLSKLISGDEEVLERISDLAEPGPRSTAILFVDIQSSSHLSKQLASDVYFELIRDFSQSIGKIVSSHAGLIGKHVGDGASAFFVASEHGAESAAIRAAIVSAREIQTSFTEIAAKIGQKYGINDALNNCLVNAGIHWGNSLYMGEIGGSGRIEVTALGDEVNECSRIEEVAKEGQILISKQATELLSETDADFVEINRSRATYNILHEIAGPQSKAAIEKINLPVTEV
jgi:class 3 adenylate cyclase